MSIENRNLTAGTKLVARYKGQSHSAVVLETDDGLRYRLEDGREFKSPSSAGSAVMSGKACNGWKFWSLAGEIETKPAKTKKPSKPKVVTFERMDDAPDGQPRFYCTACAEAFMAPADVKPIGCPKGHTPDEQATFQEPDGRSAPVRDV